MLRSWTDELNCLALSTSLETIGEAQSKREARGEGVCLGGVQARNKCADIFILIHEINLDHNLGFLKWYCPCHSWLSDTDTVFFKKITPKDVSFFLQTFFPFFLF
jgi:hypothetical protein